MFRFEFGYPYGSCYTEPDIRYLTARSKSLSFNNMRFRENADWMGVSSRYPDSKHRADILESMYFVESEGSYRSRVGTRLADRNGEPFFYRWGDSVSFTLRAFFAGRDWNKKERCIRYSCDGKCFICKAQIGAKREPYWDKLNEGVILNLGGNRFEVICEDCWKRWRKIIWAGRMPYIKGGTPYVYCCRSEDLISLTRFILANSSKQQY